MLCLVLVAQMCFIPNLNLLIISFSNIICSWRKSDGFKMKDYYCSYCDFNTISPWLEAIHFMQEHKVNKNKNVSICPICKENRKWKKKYFHYVDDHFIKFHPQHCLLCAKDKLSVLDHTHCNDVLEEAEKETQFWREKRLLQN